jgi:hypothetical protein
MRFLLRSDSTAEELLDQLAQAAYHVVEGSIPESTAEDVRVGFYVAFHQTLADNIVRVQECGSLPSCEDLREEHPFTSHASAPARSHA